MAPVDTAADTPAPPPPEELVLAGEFPGATRDQWAALVDGVLRKSGRIGADAELGAGVDKLVRRTPEGIPVAPLYTQADVGARRHDRRPGPRRLGRAAAPRRSGCPRRRPCRPGERGHLDLAGHGRRRGAADG